MQPSRSTLALTVEIGSTHDVVNMPADTVARDDRVDAGHRETGGLGDDPVIESSAGEVDHGGESDREREDEVSNGAHRGVYVVRGPTGAATGYERWSQGDREQREAGRRDTVGSLMIRTS
jgi:hypothetical protein